MPHAARVQWWMVRLERSCSLVGTAIADSREHWGSCQLPRRVRRGGVYRMLDGREGCRLVFQWIGSASCLDSILAFHYLKGEKHAGERSQSCRVNKETTGAGTRTV